VNGLTPGRPPIDRGLLALALVFLVVFPFLFKPWVHGFDTVAYTAWLRSLVVDGDLEVGDEFAHYGYAHERGRTDTGHTVNEWAVGSAVMWSPFYLIAHVLVRLAGALGWSVPADGYSPPYVWAISLGSALYGLGAIGLTYRVARRLFPLRPALLALVTVWLSSPLVFYMYSHPAMSHACDAFAYALLIFVWHHTRHRSDWPAAALRGAAAGLCALVRQLNAVFVLVLLGELLFEAIRAQRAGHLRWKPWLARVAALCLAWWLAFLPQLIVWRVVFGQWIVLNPYRYGVGLGFDWLRPHLLEVLFSTDRGLFVWSPVLALGALGGGWLWKRDRRLTSLLTVTLALQLYVVAAWDAYSGAAAFGQRFFTNMVPAFGLGLAALLERAGQRVAWRWLVLGGLFFICWNAILLLRYAVGDVPRMGPVPLDELIGGQFSALIRYADRLLELILRRG